MMLEFISKTALAAVLFLVCLRIFEKAAHMELIVAFQRKAGDQAVTPSKDERVMAVEETGV